MSELSESWDVVDDEFELSESSDKLNSSNSRFRCGLTEVAVAEEEDLEQHSFKRCF